MALDANTTQFTIQTGTGNQTILHGLGVTPKVAIFEWTKATANGTDNDMNFGMGWTVGIAADDAAISQESDDGTATQATYVDTGRCIKMIAADATVIREADWVSWNSTEIVIDWKETGSAFLVNITTLGGDGINNVASGRKQFTSVDVAVTGEAFQGNTLIIAGNFEHAGFGVESEGANSVGFALSSTERNVSAFRWRNNGAGGSSTGFSNAHCLVGADDSTTPNDKLDFVSFDSGGFTLTYDVGSGDGFTVFLILDVDDAATGKFDQPADDGTQTYATGLGFTPTVSLFHSGNSDSDDGWVDQRAHLMLGMTTSDTKFNTVWAGKDVDDADKNSSITACIEFYDPGTPTLESTADLDSFTSTTAVVDWLDTTSNTARRIGFLLLGQGGAVRTLYSGMIPQPVF